MSSFNEAMTQIRELEERAVEELKEIIQVGSQPGLAWEGPDTAPARACSCTQHHSSVVTWASLPQVFTLAWQEATPTPAFPNYPTIRPSALLRQLIPHPLLQSGTRRLSSVLLAGASLSSPCS